jgi:hypothetical protein
MALYTVVDDGYCVNIYTTQNALVTMIYREGYLLAPPELDGNDKKPTLHAIRKAVRELEYVMYLYDAENTEWKYKVEIQKTVNIGAK